MNKLENIQLMHLCSPVFPTGMFSQSFGYETMFEDGYAEDARAYEQYLSGMLQAGSIVTEAALVKFAYENVMELDKWDTLCTAIKPTKELRRASMKTGRAFIKVINQMYPEHTLVQKEWKNCNYAIVFGYVCRYLEIPMEEALSGYITSALLSNIQVGIKLIPLSQIEGQIILKNAYEDIVVCTERAIKMKEEDIFTFTPMVDIASMRHEAMFSRMYMS